jgi:hypothetical protein
MIIKLTEWQVKFIKNAIHKAIITKITRDYTELEKFRDEFYKVYPESGVKDDN